MPENDNLCTEAENKIFSFLRNYRTCFTHFHFHNVCHKMRDHGSQLQWHSRLARRTYKSVLTKKCEGREFEPPLEQSFRRQVPILGEGIWLLTSPRQSLLSAGIPLVMFS